MSGDDEAYIRRRIRASFSERAVVVYQAYSDAIADAALEAQRFVPPFKMERMTWIKPSFLWMMYRSDWARRSGQERILAVEISRSGLDWALRHSCLSHYDARVHASREDWEKRVEKAPVRVQWDPERSLRLERMADRAIQIGLSGEAVDLYVREWIQRVEDMTPRVIEIRRLIEAGELDVAATKLPHERPYPIASDLARIVGATPEGEMAEGGHLESED